MRLVRILILILFSITAVFYGFHAISVKLTSDTVPPVITADSDEIFVSVAVTDEELLEGMHAQDNKDGDVSSSMVVVSRLDFIQKGTLKVNYAAFDKSNNVSTYTRTVTYTDYQSPRFTATKPFRFSDTEESATALSSVKVDDVLDGDLTPDIRITYGENEGIKYPVVLEVTNSAGDSAIVSVNVFLEDRMSLSVPSVALSEYIVYAGKGGYIDPAAYVIGTYQNSIIYPFTEKSTYNMDYVTWDDSGVDYNTPGEYIIKYSLLNEYGESLNETELYVIVEED